MNMDIAEEVAKAFSEGIDSFSAMELFDRVGAAENRKQLSLTLNSLVKGSVLEKKNSRYFKGDNFALWAAKPDDEKVEGIEDSGSVEPAQEAKYVPPAHTVGTPKKIASKSTDLVSEKTFDKQAPKYERGLAAEIIALNPALDQAFKSMEFSMAPLDIGESFTPEMKLGVIEYLENVLHPEIAKVLNEAWNDLNEAYSSSNLINTSYTS